MLVSNSSLCTSLSRAIFLDRDGVVVFDHHLLTTPNQIELLPGIAPFIVAIRAMGFKVFLVTNQTVVARGLLSLDEAYSLNHLILQLLLHQHPHAGIDEVFLCPHHPQAQIMKYRQHCECRKPAPGMLMQAQIKHQLNLKQSFMLGDRPSDVMAGNLAGTHTILLASGRENEPLIESELTQGLEHSSPLLRPSFRASTLPQALQFITSTFHQEFSL